MTYTSESAARRSLAASQWAYDSASPPEQPDECEHVYEPVQRHAHYTQCQCIHCTHRTNVFHGEQE